MLAKYYSLDECKTHDDVYSHLEDLEIDGKISFTIIESDDVIKISDNGLSPKELKDITKFFDDHNIIEYDNYHPSDYDEDEDEDEDWDSEYDEENDY